jgi:1-acyl-sn-glycerol-3-phosphate acyltransferase
MTSEETHIREETVVQSEGNLSDEEAHAQEETVAQGEANLSEEEAHIQEETVAQGEGNLSDEVAHIQEVASDKDEQQLSDEELRRQLVAELDELTDRLQAQVPEYEPPPFSVQRLVALIEEMLSKFPNDMRLDVLEQLRDAIGEGLLDIDVLKGAWYMLNYTVRYNVDLVKRRFTGEYDTDEWGLDWEFLDAVRPFFTFLYRFYWRVEVSGLDNIPIEGRALLVANHSGLIPWDGTMVGTAVLNDHPAQRLVRSMYSDWFPRLPFLSSWLVRMGQTLATMENGVRLLEQEELVAVFPEGYKGIGKLYKDRYRLARFGRGGFVKMALTTQAPIIPVSVVGAEETYITLAKSNMVARITGLPYVPITPTFPWLGLLGLVPLPTKWYMDFGQQIPMEPYGTDASDNLVLVSQVTDQVRHTVQDMVDERLAQRRSIFF